MPWYRQLLEYFPCTNLFRPTGSYLIFIYILTKFACIGNSIGQMAFVSYFTGTNFSFFDYGFYMVWNINAKRTWEVTGIFPRVTWCEVNAWGVGKLQGFGLQCVLPANFINEKCYIFIWFWLLVALIFNSVSILKWVYKLCFPNRRRSFVLEHLKLLVHDDSSLRDRKHREKFIKYYLKPDGIFTLHLVENQAGEIVTNDILHLLWCSFRGTVSENHCASNHPKCPHHMHHNVNNFYRRSLDDFICNDRSIRSKSNASPGHSQIGQNAPMQSELPPPPPPGMFTNSDAIDLKHRK